MSISIKANKENLGSLSEVHGVVFINSTKDEPQYRGLKIELIGMEKTSIIVSEKTGESSKSSTKCDYNKFLSKKLYFQVANIQIDQHTVIIPFIIQIINLNLIFYTKGMRYITSWKL